MIFMRNILSSKEEYKTSHTNQAYNQLVAKNNNKNSADTLDFQRNMKHVNRGVVGQYQIVLTFIFIVKDTT